MTKMYWAIFTYKVVESFKEKQVTITFLFVGKGWRKRETWGRVGREEIQSKCILALDRKTVVEKALNFYFYWGYSMTTVKNILGFLLSLI